MRQAQASGTFTPNRLGVNAEALAPVLDLGLLPSPHLVNAQLLTGPVKRVIGVDEAAALRYGWGGPSPSAASIPGALAGSNKDIYVHSYTADDFDDTDLINFIASHAERRLVSVSLSPLQSCAASDSHAAVDAGVDATIPPREPTYTWVFDLPSITAYVLSRFIAGRATLVMTVLDSSTVYQVSAFFSYPMCDLLCESMHYKCTEMALSCPF